MKSWILRGHNCKEIYITGNKTIRKELKMEKPPQMWWLFAPNLIDPPRRINLLMWHKTIKKKVASPY